MKRLTIPEIDYSAVGVVDEMRTGTIAGMLCRLAAYEDLEEQGRLIVLPCKVGDTVYKPLGKNEEILPIKIQWFETNNYGWCACGTYPPRATYALRFADLGKTWFTDRAEAEKAMEVSEDA